MPRNVRPFWLSARVDGKSTPIGTGPKALEGGMSLSVLVRDENRGVGKGVTVECMPISRTSRRIVVRDHAGMVVYDRRID